MSTRQLLPLSGVAAVGFALLGASLPGSAPESDATALEVARFYDGSARQIAAAFALAAVVPCLVVFAACLAQRGRDGDGVWPHVLRGGAVVTGATLAGEALFQLALADGGDHGISATALQAINALSFDSWIAFNCGFGVMMLGAAGCLWSAARGLERRLARVAVPVGVCLFIPYASFPALVATLVWILVAGFALREREPATAAKPVTV